MTIEAKTLVPGLLVSLKTTVSGNVTYAKRDLGETAEAGALVAKWETERTISDPAEHEAAIKIRAKARSLIVSVCAQSAFGLLCPERRADQLDLAMAEARRLVDAFNRDAKVTRVSVFMIAGRIAAEDAEAVRAINAEMSELMASMSAGLRSLDAGAVREACNKARAVSSMLAPEANARVKAAIEVARKAAREIVKAGEAGGIEIDLVAINTISNARTAFLDHDDTTETAAPEAAAGRAIDLDPNAAQADDVPDYLRPLLGEPEPEPAAPAPRAPAQPFNFELED